MGRGISNPERYATGSNRSVGKWNSSA